MKLTMQEENATLLRFANRLGEDLIESVVVNERVYSAVFFERESVHSVKYVFDCTTAIRTLTVKTIFGEYTINERADNTKAFDLLYRHLVRTSTLNATYYHETFIKLLTD